MKQRSVIGLIAVIAVSLAASHSTLADRQSKGTDAQIALYYSNDSAPSFGIDAVNKSLMSVGVRVSKVEIPAEAVPILEASRVRAVTAAEASQLISHFDLGRRELLNEITNAGRAPEMHRGGYLQTSEEGLAPYPKVYDMMALDHETTV